MARCAVRLRSLYLNIGSLFLIVRSEYPLIHRDLERRGLNYFCKAVCFIFFVRPSSGLLSGRTIPMFYIALHWYPSRSVCMSNHKAFLGRARSSGNKVEQRLGVGEQM